MKWEIEANIGCCDSCRNRVEKYLKGVQGVESVDLYPEIRKVVVMGNADPDNLLHEVKKVKKEARILGRGGSSPIKTSRAMDDDLGRHSEKDNNTKDKAADEVIHEKEGQESEKAITIYKPSKPSNGRDKVASESKTCGADLAEYGFGVGFLYRWAKTYKR